MCTVRGDRQFEAALRFPRAADEDRADRIVDFEHLQVDTYDVIGAGFFSSFFVLSPFFSSAAAPPCACCCFFKGPRLFKSVFASAGGMVWSLQYHDKLLWRALSRWSCFGRKCFCLVPLTGGEGAGRAGTFGMLWVKHTTPAAAAGGTAADAPSGLVVFLEISIRILYLHTPLIRFSRKIF